MGQRGRRWGRAAQQQGKAPPEEKPGPGSLFGRGALLELAGRGGSRGRRVPGPGSAGREDHSWGSPPDRMLPTSSQRAGTCWVSRIHGAKAGRAAGPRVRRIGGFPPCCCRLNPSAFPGQERWHCATLALVQDGVLRSQRPAHWWWAGPSGPLLLGVWGNFSRGCTPPGRPLLEAAAAASWAGHQGASPVTHAGLAAWGLPRPQKPEPF